jgi:GNAT superfamily N-acetyltransferase
MNSYSWREATLDDVDTLIRHRREMFAEMGHLDRLDAVTRASGEWFRRSLAAGVYRAWLAIAPDGSIAAGGGITIIPWPPGPLDLGDRAAYVYNVFTEPAHRRRGLARELMLRIHDWCRREGVHSVRLHASAAGRPLYASIGYKATNEMRIILTAD